MTIDNIIKRIDAGIDYDLIQGANFDQFKDFTKIDNALIVFSEDVIKTIISMLNDTKNNLRENGCFLYGKEIINNYIVVDEIGEPFLRNTTAVETTQDHVYEMAEKINLYDGDKRLHNIIIDFHTHPRLDDYGYKPDRMSDQDLYMYGVLQKYHQHNTEEATYYLGMLGSISNNGFKLSCVFYDNKLKKFFTITNFYCQDGNEVKKITNEDFNLTRLNIKDKILLKRKR